MRYSIAPSRCALRRSREQVSREGPAQFLIARGVGGKSIASQGISAPRADQQIELTDNEIGGKFERGRADHLSPWGRVLVTQASPGPHSS